MKEMSISRQISTDLVMAYDHSLGLQILGRGSSLVCRDEELCKNVEVLLRDGDALEIHSPGLDPLRVIEESLKASAAAAAATTASPAAGRGKARGGLQGLAKAFEVVEQAALNLYLGPWREEYKVVKMYSGTFTHYIKPVLSMQQIEKLFGLLGYQTSSPRHEQLRLQSARVRPNSSPDFLCLSCAFFLARCECHLLLTALGKHIGEAQWELSMVKERLRGNSLQVALDNTRKMLEVDQPPFDGELEMDLYTDEQVNGCQRAMVTSDDDSPRSLTWVTQSVSSPPAVKRHSNGMNSFTSLSTSLSTREEACNSSLTRLSPLDCDTTRRYSASMIQDRYPLEESMFDTTGSQSHSLLPGAEANHLCLCLQSSPIRLKYCQQCHSLHSSTCALLQRCHVEGHHVLVKNDLNEEAASPERASPTLSSSIAAMSSLDLSDDPKSMTPSPSAIAFHDCCNLKEPDPQVLCFDCGVFHSGSCRDIENCKSLHKILPLGLCSCGRTCSRSPLVLCRCCGREYCSDCWYRSPLVCTCGQPFALSSSV